MIPANILFLLVSIIQNSYGFIKLNPSDYYVESIPFILEPMFIISLNLTFALISFIVLYQLHLFQLQNLLQSLI